MLTVGIAIMVTSVVLGIIALTLVAVTSSTARSTGRSIRFAMALSDEPERTTPSYDRARGGAIAYERDAPQPAEERDAPYQPAEEPGAPYQPAEEQDAPYGPAEEQDAPYGPAEEQDAPHGPVEEQDDAPYQPAAGQEPYYSAEQEPYYPREDDPAPLAAELQDAPRWVLAMTILSGAGLVLGMLMVMIASIT